MFFIEEDPLLLMDEEEDREFDAMARSWTPEEATEFGRAIALDYYEDDDDPPDVELPDKAYEIMGYTCAHYMNYHSLEFFRAWKRDVWEPPVVFLRYVNKRLYPCTFEQAYNTPEYRKWRIFLFGTVLDEVDEYGDVVYNTVIPQLAIIGKGKKKSGAA